MAAVADFIVYTNRDGLKQVVVDFAKLKQISNVVTPETADDAVEALKRFPKAPLTIDWETSPVEAARVLGANRRSPEGGIRPILLVASGISDKLVTTAAEYGVSLLYTDKLEAKAMAGILSRLIVVETQPDDFKRTMKEVQKLRDKGDHAKAVTPLFELQKKHPNDIKIACELAASLLQVDRFDEAKKLLERFADRDPPNLRAIHLLGRCLMREGKWREAERVLAKASLFNPNDAERLIDLGNCLLEMDKVKEAAAKFDQALSIDPSLTEAKLGKGKVMLVEGQVNAALGLLKEMTTPRELASLFNVAAVLNIRQGRFEGGMQLYLAAVKALGSDAKLHARLLFNMGIGYRRWRKPDKALQCFEQAVQYDPEYARAKEQVQIVQAAAASGTEPEEKNPASWAEGAAQAIQPPSPEEIAAVLDGGKDLDLEESLDSFDDDFGDEDFLGDDLEEKLEI